MKLALIVAAQLVAIVAILTVATVLTLALERRQARRRSRSLPEGDRS